MKAITTLPAPASARQPIAKKLLMKGIIYLTSEKFCTFVTAIAALICTAGVCIDDEHVIGYGGIVFLVGFTRGLHVRRSAKCVRTNSALKSGKSF